MTESRSGRACATNRREIDSANLRHHTPPVYTHTGNIVSKEAAPANHHPLIVIHSIKLLGQGQSYSRACQHFAKILDYSDLRVGMIGWARANWKADRHQWRGWKVRADPWNGVCKLDVNWMLWLLTGSLQIGMGRAGNITLVLCPRECQVLALWWLPLRVIMQNVLFFCLRSPTEIQVASSSHNPKCFELNKIHPSQQTHIVNVNEILQTIPLDWSEEVSLIKGQEWGCPWAVDWW